MFELLKDGWGLFFEGGAIMYMLGGVACILYATAFAAWAYVRQSDFDEKQSELWAGYIENPKLADGRLGEVLGYVLHGPRLSIKTVNRRFAEVRIDLLAAIDRRLLVLNTLVAAAPLAGLLGTVMGMLAMFAGLSHGKGPAGMQKVADGMQQALITTQTGLTIALPGLFIGLMIKAKRDRIQASLARLESMILSARFHRENNSIS